MDDIYLTYDEAAKAMGIKPASVRRRAALRKWPKRLGNDGLARVGIPRDAIPLPRDITPDSTPDVAPDATDDKDARIAELSAEVKGLREHLETAREAATDARAIRDDVMRERDAMRAERDAALARRWWRWR